MPWTHSWRTISRTFPLCTVPLWDLSLDMKTHGLYCMYFLWWYRVTLLTYVEKGGMGGEVCCETVTTSLHVLPPVSHFDEERSSPFTETDIFLLVRVKNKHFSSPWKPKELILLPAECSLKEICPRYQRPRWICSTFKLTEPTVCQTTVLKK